MNTELINRLQALLDSEALSCSMETGCVTPEYVCRMWGSTVPIEDIKDALDRIKKQINQ